MRDASFTTHALSPQALLQVFRDLQGEAPPPCTLLAIRGERFELGTPPSAAALAHLDAALLWAHAWLAADQTSAGHVVDVCSHSGCQRERVSQGAGAFSAAATAE